jgi:RHS repeat-associated protein
MSQHNTSHSSTTYSANCVSSSASSHRTRSRSALLKQYHPLLFQLTRTWHSASRTKRHHILVNLLAVIILLVTSFPIFPVASAQPLANPSASVPAVLNTVETSTATTTSTSNPTSSPSPSSTPTTTASVTPPPPTYTVGTPTSAPTVSPIPDTNYVQQSADINLANLLANIESLPVLSSTISGTLVSGTSGGRITSADGVVTLAFMTETIGITESIYIEIEPLTFEQDDPQAYHNGNPVAYAYNFTATDLDGQPVTQFNKNVAIVWNMDLSYLHTQGIYGFPFFAYTYNDQTLSWEEIPSRWSAQKSQLVASTLHFSPFATAPIFDKVKNYLPSVSNFEVNLQSGNSTLQYPLNLPPGPAGFGPKVSLSYNSGNVDRVAWSQQGTSSVGWGWSLSTNYIAATQHHYGENVSCDPGEPRGYHPWTASIVVDGINGDITEGEDGTVDYWHSSNESFARIRYNPGAGSSRTTDSWEAWDKSGTHYVFDLNALVLDEWYDAQGDLCGGSSFTTYKWMLRTATDVHGNTVNYSYWFEKGNGDLSDTELTNEKTRAVYPKQITWGAGGDKLSAEFHVASRVILDEDEKPVDDISPADENGGTYQSYRIDKVDVRRKQQAAPTATPSLLRSYEFSQSYSIVLTEPTRTNTPTPTGTPTETPEPVEYPHLTLNGITVKGNDGTTQLPSMTFDYWSAISAEVVHWDWGHLREARTGYEGFVRFYYDMASSDAHDSYRRVRAKKIDDGISVSEDGGAFPHIVTYFYDYRGGNDNRDHISADASQQYPNYYPLKTADSEWRGFTWVREINPMGQATDHYYNQDDVYRGKEWRVQVGKADIFTDTMDLPTPTATLASNGNWTVSGLVRSQYDPDPRPTEPNNITWRLETGGSGASIERSSFVGDGSDVMVKFRLTGDPTDPNTSFSNIWKLTSTTGNNYWGLKVYRQSQTCGSGPSTSTCYVYHPKLIWNINGTTGERDLRKDPNNALPRMKSELLVNQWYWMRLHTSPDGRFMAEIYKDDFVEDHPDQNRDPLSLPNLYGDYLGIKSTDPWVGATPIPTMPTGLMWRFKQELAGASGTKVYADNYAESRTLYSQSDLTHELRSGTPTTLNTGQPLVGQANNVHHMYISFVPLIQSVGTTYGAPPNELWVVRQTKTSYDYDSHGNQSRVDNYGDVSSQGDESRTNSVYAVAEHINPSPTPSQYIIDRIGLVTQYEGITTTTIMAETQYFYDYNTANYGQLPNLPDGKGRLTQTRQLGVLDGEYKSPNATTKFHFDDYGNQDIITNTIGIPITTTYDLYYHSFPITITQPNGRNMITEYDYVLDVVSSTVDMNGTTTVYRSDVFGRPERSWIKDDGYNSDYDHPNERYAFSDIGQESVQAPFYVSYTVRLDENAGSAGYSYAMQWYDGRGRVLQEVSPKDPTTNEVVIANTTYTVTGALSSTILPYTATVANPLIYNLPNTNKPKTINYYDGAGRPSMVINPDGIHITYDYTLLQWVGVSEVMTGTIKHEKWQHTDLLGRTDQVEEREVNIGGPYYFMILNYDYDMLGRLTEVQREGNDNPTTEIHYDPLGRKSRMVDPDMGTWKYEYDAVGNMIVQTDSLHLDDPVTYAGHEIFFDYDSMNRLKAKYYGDSHHNSGIADVKYYYDNDLGDASSKKSWGKLRLMEVTAQGQGSGKANGHGYEYDVRGLTVADVVTITSPSEPYRVSYTYDVGKRLKTITYPDPTEEQVTVTYNRQGFGMPKVVSSSATAYPSPVADATYNERGQLTKLVQGSGNNVLTTVYSYTMIGWLSNTMVTAPNGAGGTNILLNLGLSYTANGNIASVSNQNITNPGSNNPTFTNSFTYDGLNRLRSATSTSSLGSGLFADESYSFDAIGRMTTRYIGTTSYDYDYEDSEHIDAPTAYQDFTFEYDAAGNQVERTDTKLDITQQRTVDAENRVVGILEGAVSTQMVYDGNGKRVIQNVTTLTEDGEGLGRTLYVGSLYEEELTGSEDRPYTVYYILGQQMVGLRRGNQSSDNGQYRIATDHLQSTSLLVNTSSPPVVAHRQYYKPYGAIAWETGSDLTTVGYAGQRLDSASGLMYFGARYYDTNLSMFTSTDSTTPDSSKPMDYNKYLYVRGNPLRYIDPSGYGPEDHYVFVYGCVTAPLNEVGANISPCANEGPRSFNEFGDLLRELWKTWVAQYSRLGETFSGMGSFAAWRAEHVHQVMAGRDVKAASFNLASTLRGIQGDGDIHLWGHSQGVAAIMDYLISEGFPRATCPICMVDQRIASIALIDGSDEGANRRYPTLVDDLMKYTRVKKGDLLQVKVTHSFLHPECINGFDCRTADYSDPRRTDDDHIGTPTSSPNDWTDPVRQDWHGFSYKALKYTNYQTWFEKAWR